MIPIGDRAFYEYFVGMTLKKPQRVRVFSGIDRVVHNVVVPANIQLSPRLLQTLVRRINTPVKNPDRYKRVPRPKGIRPKHG